MDDQDFRDEIARLARLVEALAADDDATTRQTTSKHAYHMALVSGAAGRLEIRHGYKGYELVGADRDGIVAVSLAVSDSATGLHSPYDMTAGHALAGIRMALDAAARASLSDGVALPAGATDATIESWRAAVGIMAGLAVRDGAMETSIRQTEGRIKADGKPLGKRPWHGFTQDVEAMVASLPPLALLQWTRAESGQALAKRRANGLPPMGRADMRRSSLAWRPDTAMATAVPIGMAVLRPALVVVRMPEQQVGATFDWHLGRATEIGIEMLQSTLVHIGTDLAPTLLELLRLDEENVRRSPRLKRSGSYWVEDGVPMARRIKITAGQARRLIQAGLLHTEVDDDFGDTLLYGSQMHDLMRTMGTTGYQSWKSVTTIDSHARVPVGVPNHPGEHSWEPRQGAVEATDNGYLSLSPYVNEWSRRWDAEPVADRSRSSRPVIDVVQADSGIWPDFGPLEPDGSGGFTTQIDPGLDHRTIPGPLGRLYRMPVADRVLARRWLFSRLVDQTMSRDWYAWAHEH